MRAAAKKGLRFSVLLAVALSSPSPAFGDVQTESAESLYELGARSFAAHDYETAVDYFRASFLISGDARLLYDAAQAYRLANACGKALVLYRAFLDTQPNGKLRELAEGHASELSTCVDAPPAEADSEAKQPAPIQEARADKALQGSSTAAVFASPSHERSRLPAPAKGRSRAPALVAEFGAAVALFAASGYFTWQSRRASQTVQQAFDQRGTWSDDLSRAERQAGRDQKIAIGTFVGGVLASGVGVWTLVFD
jgi:hypothetical protein